MAQQIKFYSVAAGTTKNNNNGIYFDGGGTTGELYKGAVRFGAPRVTKATTNSALSAIAGMIRGDVNIGYEGTKVYDGTSWVAMGPDNASLRSSWISDINNAVDGLVFSAAAVSSESTDEDVYNLVTAITASYDETSGLIELSAIASRFKFGDVIDHMVVESAEVGDLASFSTPTFASSIPEASAIYKVVDAQVISINNAINTKASKGTITITANTSNHGVAATLNLPSNAAPDGTITTTPATVNANFGTSEYLTTGKVVYAHTSGLAKGNGTTYINQITYANGKLTATASTTIHASTDIGDATDASRGLTDVYAVKNYVDGKVSAMGNVLVFKSTSYEASETYAKGDVILFADASQTYGLNDSGIAVSGADVKIPFAQGMEIVCVDTSNGTNTWEVIGDQNKWVDKVTGGTSTASSNGVEVKVTTSAVSAKPTVLVTAPAYNPGEFSKTGADNGVNVTVKTSKGQVTATTVVVSEAALATNFSISGWLTTGSTVYLHTSGLSKGGDASYIQKIAYDTTTGKLTATAKPFPSYDYNPNASTCSSTNNGTTVSVTTQNGKVTKVEVKASNWTPGNGASTTTSYGVTISASTVAGVQKSANITVSPITTSTGITAEATTSLATAAAIKEYVDGAIDAIDFPVPSSGTSGDSDKGVQVSVTTDGGVVTSVDVQTTLQTTIATTNTHNEIPSAKAVSNALCWYKEDGTTLW